MKIAGIIFSILFLTLNAVPCCWDSCWEEEPVEHSGSEQTCSPFLSCGSCAGFILEQDLPEVNLNIEPLVTETGFPENGLYSEFIETIWQPPQVK